MVIVTLILLLFQLSECSRTGSSFHATKTKTDLPENTPLV